MHINLGQNKQHNKKKRTHAQANGQEELIDAAKT